MVCRLNGEIDTFLMDQARDNGEQWSFRWHAKMMCHIASVGFLSLADTLFETLFKVSVGEWIPAIVDTVEDPAEQALCRLLPQHGLQPMTFKGHGQILGIALADSGDMGAIGNTRLEKRDVVFQSHSLRVEIMAR